MLPAGRLPARSTCTKKKYLFVAGVNNRLSFFGIDTQTSKCQIGSHSVPVVPYQLSHFCLLILMYFHATSTYSQPLRDMWHLHSWKQLLCARFDKDFSSLYLDTTQEGNLFWITTRELFQEVCSFLSCKRLSPGNQTRFQIPDSLANITLTWIISERDQKKNSV